MRISPITFNNVKFNNFSNKQKSTPVNSSAIGRAALPMPVYANYLAFCGGSSLNLRESVENLDKLSIKNGGHRGDKFPRDIYEYALSVIKSGNPEDYTLVDVHKQKYSILNDCYNLDDVKALFEEFGNVISDSKVDYKDDSFIAKVKRGEVDNFNKDEDLALQLLKLYWAQGFSLNDLKRYADNVDLYHTIKKLNIPTLDRDYAHVLKFSDKDYNERITSIMTQRRLESMERKIQEADGEPVFIPRGPLSDMHKKHISEALINHYAEHPEKIVQMSQRQKEYFETHPEQIELLRDVGNYAFNNTQEGRSIKKYMVKFFKKYNVPFDDNILNGNADKTSKSQQELFAKFWELNGWAKEKASVAMKKAWQFAKDMSASAPSEASIYSINLAPKGLIDEMRAWCKQNNIPMSESAIISAVRFQPTDCQGSYAKKIFNKFILDNQDVVEDIKSALLAAMFSVRSDIIAGKITPQICSDETFLTLVVLSVNNSLIPNGDFKIRPITDVRDDMSSERLFNLMDNISLLATASKCDKFIQYINEKIDMAYDIVNSAKEGYSGRVELNKFLYAGKTV